MIFRCKKQVVLSLQWCHSTLRFKFMTCSQSVGTRRYSSVRYPLLWATMSRSRTGWTRTGINIRSRTRLMVRCLSFDFKIRCLVAVVGQRYAVNVMDEHVLRGNAAIIKCHIPSFVAEFVEIDSWVEDETNNIYPKSDYGTTYRQCFSPNSFINTFTILIFVHFFYSSSFNSRLKSLKGVLVLR